MKELRDSEHTVFCSEFTPDSRNLITTDANGDLRLWDVFSNHSKPVATLEEAHDLGSFPFRIQEGISHLMGNAVEKTSFSNSKYSGPKVSHHSNLSSNL